MTPSAERGQPHPPGLPTVAPVAAGPPKLTQPPRAAPLDELVASWSGLSGCQTTLRPLPPPAAPQPRFPTWGGGPGCAGEWDVTLPGGPPSSWDGRSPLLAAPVLPDTWTPLS